MEKSIGVKRVESKYQTYANEQTYIAKDFGGIGLND